MYIITQFPRLCRSDTFVILSTMHNPTVPHTHTGNDTILNIIFKSNKFLACSKIPSVTNLIVN